MSGTVNNIAKFTSANAVGDSAITESAGNVGIGTTNPATKLQAIGTIRAGTANDGLEIGNFVSTDAGIRNFGTGSHLLIDSDNIRFRSKDGTTSYIEIKSTGNVGIGTIVPTERLEVVGNIKASGAVTQGSSREIKRDISDVSAKDAMKAEGSNGAQVY